MLKLFSAAEQSQYLHNSTNFFPCENAAATKAILGTLFVLLRQKHKTKITELSEQ